MVEIPEDEFAKGETIMMYLKYLWYVLKHKWFVMLECFKMGLIWQGLVHDNSKFLPDEFFSYANHFHGPKAQGIKTGRDKTGYYKPYDTGDAAFDTAWFLHQKRNKHHWQWWCMPIDPIIIYSVPEQGKKKKYQPSVGDLKRFYDAIIASQERGTPLVVSKSFTYEIEVMPDCKPLKIPTKYVKEMICDWRGAGRAQGTLDTKAWYEKNGQKMQLHPDTRKEIEILLYDEIR